MAGRDELGGAGGSLAGQGRVGLFGARGQCRFEHPTSRATFTACLDGSMTVCFMPMGGPINYCIGEKLIAIAVGVAPRHRALKTAGRSV